MFKIDTNDASGTEPARPPSGTLRYFSSALRTTVTDWWLNMVQNEISNAVTRFGLTLDKSDDHQLGKAIEAAISSAINLNRHSNESTAGVVSNVETTLCTISDTFTGNVTVVGKVSFSGGYYGVKHVRLYVDSVLKDELYIQNSYGDGASLEVNGVVIKQMDLSGAHTIELKCISSPALTGIAHKLVTF